MQPYVLELIIYLMGNLFRLYIIGFLFRIFFTVEGTRKRRVIRMVAYGIVYIIDLFVSIWYSFPFPIVLLINAIGISLISVTYLGSWQYRIIAVILSISTHELCENFVYHLALFLGTKHIVIVVIMSTNIIFFMVVLILRKMVNLKNHIEISMAEWLSVIGIPILSFIFSMISLGECRSQIAAAIGEISLVLINILLFFLLDKIQANYEKQLEMMLLKSQNQAYEKQILLLKESEEKITSLRHDLKNHLFSLEQFLFSGNFEAAKKYLKELGLEIFSQKSISETGNFIIDGMLNWKLGQAIESGIHVTTRLIISEELEIDSRDLSIILGNLLDNAIEGASKCERDKRICVNMFEAPGRLILKIQNSYEGTVKKNGGKFVSTKRDKNAHGIGLKNVQRVVRKYNGYMEINCDKEQFSVELLIYL